MKNLTENRAEKIIRMHTEFIKVAKATIMIKHGFAEMPEDVMSCHV